MSILKRELGFAIDSSWLLPSVGFASFLFVADTVNAPVLLADLGAPSYTSLLLSVAMLVAAAWLVAKLDWEDRWSLPGIVVSTLLISLYYLISLFFPAIMQDPVLSIAADVASVLGRAGLSFFWMIAILPLGSRRVCLVLTVSICIFSLFCVAIVLFKDDAARVLLIALPLISTACLQTFYRKREESFEIANPAKDEISVQTKAYLDKRANLLVYGTGIVIPLVCGSAVLAIVRQGWSTQTAGAAELFSAQMGLFAGAIIIAVVQMILVYYFWASTNVMFASVIIPQLLTVMLLISASAPSLVMPYYALLVIVEKSLIAFGVYSTYMFRISKNWIIPWCIAFLSFHLGDLLGLSILKLLPVSNPTFTIVGIMAIYVSSVCFASLYFGAKITQAYESQLAEGFRGERRYQTAIEELSAKNKLTSREGDILAELGRGRNAAYIAERLTISPQTAKTHQKNIYAKMGIHSQQDLIMLIDQEIEGLHSKG